MAGSDPRFPSAKFREGILFAMTMAKPNAVEEQTTFYRDIDGTYVRTDPGNRPYNWGATPTIAPSRDEVIVDSVVDYIPRTSMSDVNAIGEFNVSRAEILIFSEGYEEIKDIRATHVKVGGADYRISSVSPPIVLFDVEMYQVYAEALDES